MTTIDSPREIYAQKIVESQHRLSILRRQDLRLIFSRLGMFVLFLAVLVLNWNRDPVYWLWSLLPLGLFVLICRRHEKIRQRKDKTQRLVDFFINRRTRFENTWIGKGNCGEEHRDPDHLYADDLDLFGEGSLFEYLNTCQTQMGSQTLARWLKNPPPFKEIIERQTALKELSTQQKFREELASLPCLDPQALLHWQQQTPDFRANRWFAYFLGLTSLILLVTWLLGLTSIAWALLFFLADMIYLTSKQKDLQAILNPLENQVTHTQTLLTVVKIFDGFNASSPFLKKRLDQLKKDDALKNIENLHRIMYQVANSRRNQLLIPIAILLLWPIHLALKLNEWKKQFGQNFDQWLELIGELEALVCLSAWVFEQPQACWPQPRSEAQVFRITKVKHPLLPSGHRQGNDLSLDTNCPMWIISGSNMSGKSTFLRTVGTTWVMARLGAPVLAQSCQLSDGQLASSIQLRDSLKEGRSRFYTEVLRLKKIVDLSEKTPVFFLLDEILSGTNSEDRNKGAQLVLKKLNSHQALGLVTTHDLKLTELPDQGILKAQNYHFKDNYDGNELNFDYTLRPGVLPSGNALTVMKIAGLVESGE